MEDKHIKTTRGDKYPLYLPFLNGSYSTAAGLRPLCKATGKDARIFQFDEKFQVYMDNKQACRKEDAEKYLCDDLLSGSDLNTVCSFILKQLLIEYPELFIEEKSNNCMQIACKLSHDRFQLTSDNKIIGPSGFLTLFDALCSQVQEDVAVISLEGGSDRLVACHICAPNHWASMDKYGNNFDFIHSPVPGMEKMRSHYLPMLRSVLDKGPYYRFGWGISTDTRLNHHPVPPAGVDPLVWKGRAFDPDGPSLYLRVERQTLSGVPATPFIVFTIRTYFYDVADLLHMENAALTQAVESMSQETLNYKGLADKKQEILDYLGKT